MTAAVGPPIMLLDKQDEKGITLSGHQNLPTNPAPTKQMFPVAFSGKVLPLEVDVERVLLSSIAAFAFSSGEPARELGGDVSGVPRSHELATHEPGVEMPVLIVEVIDWLLGKDRLRCPCWKGRTSCDSCVSRMTVSDTMAIVDG